MEAINIIHFNRAHPHCFASVRIVLCIILVLSLAFIPSLTCATSSIPFTDDVDALNFASQSIVLLTIFDENNTEIATGSGFFAFDSLSIITNYHVIENGFRIVASDERNNTFSIPMLMAYDIDHDIAILGVQDALDYQPLPLGDSDTVRRGEKVVAIGSPLGVINSISTGIISAVENYNESELLLFTAPVSHGSSGGALFNSQGQVIGITSASLTEGQNVNVAVSVNSLKALWNSSSQPISLPDHFKQYHVSHIPTIHSGTLTIATSGDFFPYTFVDESGQLSGIEIDIIKNIANQLSLAVSFKVYSFEDTLNSLHVTTDCVVNGMEFSYERLKTAFSTISYATITDEYGSFSPVFYVDNFNSKLQGAINKCLYQMKKNGSIDEYIAKYF